MNVSTRFALQNEPNLWPLTLDRLSRRSQAKADGLWILDFGLWTLDFGLMSWPNAGEHFAGVEELGPLGWKPSFYLIV